MTKEDKELLLKDICARLGYGVICQMEDKFIINDSPFYDYTLSERHVDLFRNHKDFYIKPYLRPMTSMTEKEKTYIKNRWGVNECGDIEIEDNCNLVDLSDIRDFIDWLNKNMFDYRGLIEKGLALEASEGTY